MKLVIVGGVAGGASAAARARRLSEAAEIILIERGPDVSFANCGLPYHIGGAIPDRAKLLVVSVEQLRTRLRLDVRPRSSVERIDRVGKTVRIREVDSGRDYDESYDKLILAPGAAPLRPPINGIDLPGVFTLRNLPDIPGIAAQVFTANAQAGVMVDMIVQNISQSGHANISFTVPRVALERSLEVTREVLKNWEKIELTSEREIAKLSVMGIGLRSHTGVGEKMFRALAEAGINVQMISTSEIRICTVVDLDRGAAALACLLKAFGLAEVQ